MTEQLIPIKIRKVIYRRVFWKCSNCKHQYSVDLIKQCPKCTNQYVEGHLELYTKKFNGEIEIIKARRLTFEEISNLEKRVGKEMI